MNQANMMSYGYVYDERCQLDAYLIKDYYLMTYAYEEYDIQVTYVYFMTDDYTYDDKFLVDDAQITVQQISI